MAKPRLQSIKPRVSTIDTSKGSRAATERIRGYELVKIRKRIALRDDYTCQACGRATAHGEVDHVQPLHLGGQETDGNRQYLCVDCHKLKSEKEEKERNK